MYTDSFSGRSCLIFNATHSDITADKTSDNVITHEVNTLHVAQNTKDFTKSLHGEQRKQAHCTTYISGLETVKPSKKSFS